MLASQPFDFFFVSSSLFLSFYAPFYPLKCDPQRLSVVGVFFAEISYNSNSNSNRGNKVDNTRIMHNSTSISNSNSNIKEIVRTSSCSSINAIMRITSG